MRNHRVLRALTAAVAFLPALAPTPTDPLQQLADQVAKSGMVGIQLRMTRDGHSRVVRAGRAVIGTQRPVPAGGRFRIGSITKTFVATVVLQLVGEGRVDLDAPVGGYLPGVLPRGDRITVRMLLQHTSGVHDYEPDLPTKGREYLKIRFTHQSEPAMAAVAAAKPLEFQPGTSWRYSSTNYLLAGMLIKAVTGHDWRREVTARIIRPLGLRDTFAPGDRTFLGGPHAHGYLAVDGRPVDVTEMNPTIAGASGEIVSTTADLDRLLVALVKGSLLRPTQRADMLRTLPFSHGFGLGLSATPTSCGVTAWGHTGGIVGYGSDVITSLDGSRRVQVSVTPYEETGETFQTLLELIDKAFCG